MTGNARSRLPSGAHSPAPQLEKKKRKEREREKKEGVGVRRGGSLAFFVALLIPAGACLPQAQFMAVTEAAEPIRLLSALNEVKLHQREASCGSISCKF